MKIFILLVALLNFILGRHLGRKRGPWLILDCHRDCFWHPLNVRCVARRQQLCPQLLTLVSCLTQAATCKWRNRGCIVKQNTCDRHCIQAPLLIAPVLLAGQPPVNHNLNCV